MERIWRSRLRWRVRGAWLWPAFAAFVVVDAVLLRELPISGRHTAVIPALLLAAFFNLVAVALLGPLLGLLLRRRRPSLPKVVANDYAGTGLVVAVALGLLAAGLAHRPAILRERRDRAAQFAAFRGYVRAHAPVYAEHLSRADTRLIGPRYYRTCVPGDDPRRALCLFIDASRSPPRRVVDPSNQPNAGWAGVPPGPP